MKRIIIKEEYCIGCRLCEIHCLVQHSKSKEIIKAYKGEYPKPLPRILVEEKSHLSFALQCRHCEDAPCLEACMSGAMHRDKDTKAVLCDEDKCIGCWMCLMVCPFGVIKRDATGKKIASKCDLCFGAEKPVCVVNCPNEAIVFEEVKEPLPSAEAVKPKLLTDKLLKIKDKSEYLIIGNSAAAVRAVEAIRENDKNGSILLVSDETHHAYSRPMISYLLGGKVKDSQMYYRTKGSPNDFYETNSVETILGRKVIKIDTQNKNVVLEDKQKIQFEKLLITTGCKPIVPEIKGKGLHGIFTVTAWDDAVKIKKYIDENKVKKAVIIGGGLIGLKATESLLALNEKGQDIKITIIELADRILSATFDKKASGIIEDALRKNGCAILTKSTVEKIAGTKAIKEVVLKTKKKIQADMLIFAIGVSPDISLAKEAIGIKTNRGIVVDDHMQTSIPGIYSAGDCCEAKDMLLNISRPIAIWPNATKQGELAGSNMSGVEKSYKGSFAMNSVELCGIPTVSAGITDPPKEKGYEIMEFEPPETEDKAEHKPVIYKKLVLKNNVIIGMIFVGDIARAGIYTGLIRDKVNVADIKENLLKEDFGLISLPKEYRKHMVSGSGIEV